MRKRRRNFNSKSKNIETEKEEGKSFLTDAGIVLAFLTAFSYLIAFSYKKGYKSFYGLDEMFLSDVKIIDILIAMTSISSVVTFGVATLQVFSEITPKNSENPVSLAFKNKFAPIAIVLIILSYAFINDGIMLIILGILFIIVILWIFVLNPFVFIKNEIGYENRMRKYAQKGIQVSVPEMLKILYKGNKPLFIICLSLWAFGAAGFTNFYGSNKAEMAKDYVIVNQNKKNYVVIDNNDGNYTLAPVNIKKAIIKKEFIIIEGKSELSKPIVFKHYHFKKGLKVE